MDTCASIRLSRREVIATAAAAAGCGLAMRWSGALAAPAGGPVLQRPIPRSGELLPVIGIGTSIVFDIGEDAEKRAARRRVIETLVEGGGKLIDTAPSYGAAESVLGDLLADTGLRERIFLATKVAVRDRAGMVTEMRRSLRRLRTDKVDLMQLHNVRDPKTELGLLREWKAQGTCRYVGITSSFPQDYEAVEAVLGREKPDFFQINYSLADREAEKRLLPLAKDVGAAVLINLPFGRGRLFRLVRGRTVPEWAAEFDALTWGQFFLKFLLSHEAVTAVIPGTDKVEYMLDNLNAGRGRLPNPTMRAKMVAFIASLG